MTVDVAASQGEDRRRVVSRWAAGLSAFVAIAPTTFVLVEELRSEFEGGGSIEPHEVVTIGFVVVVLGAISFALIVSALPSTAHPELSLAAATGGFVALGLITGWFGGVYAVAAGLSIVAWSAGRTSEGPSIAAQLVAAFASVAAVIALSVAENVLSDALWP